MMWSFPFISIENFKYSPAEHETEVGSEAEVCSEAEAHFCSNLENYLIKKNTCKNEWYVREE